MSSAAHGSSTPEASRGGGGEGRRTGERHRAGWFDIRIVIGTLLAIYGLVLIAMGIFDNTDAQLARADGVNANLWTGLAVLAVGALLIAWARIRPIVVDESQLERDKEEEARPPAH